MKIGIIGAGFTGLSAAYDLVKKGHKVTVFESSDKPGGLAGGFRAKNWEWAIEQHYHHLFVSDWAIRNLAEEINHEINFSRPKTSILIGNKIYQLDSPLSLLTFPHIPLTSRLRAGLSLLFLKLTNNWKSLETFTAKDFLIRSMGNSAWKVLWEPLFVGKFGNFSDKIPASWFWARIKKRSASLGYPVRGFEDLAQTLSEKIQKLGGVVLYRKKVLSIEKKKTFTVRLNDKSNFEFDKIICTLPTTIFTDITKGLPDVYVNTLKKLEGLGAVTLVLSLNKSFFEDGTYWLNINNRKYPFLALVEHTNLVDKKYYNNENIIYIGNYLPTGHDYFVKSETELVNLFLPALREINPKFNKSWIIDSYIFKAFFAQPIVPLNYSNKIPSIKTPIEGLYLANIQQVYPWDRGTNYAVELGQKVAKIISH